MMIQNNVLDDLLEIKIGRNQSLLHELVDMFFEQTPERFAQLRSAIKNNNRDSISRTAHALKAAVQTVRVFARRTCQHVRAAMIDSCQS